MNAVPFQLVINRETVSIHTTLADAKEVAEALIAHRYDMQIRSGRALWQFDHVAGQWRQR